MGASPEMHRLDAHRTIPHPRCIALTGCCGVGALVAVGEWFAVGRAESACEVRGEAEACSRCHSGGGLGFGSGDCVALNGIDF